MVRDFPRREVAASGLEYDAVVAVSMIHRARRRSPVRAPVNLSLSAPKSAHEQIRLNSNLQLPHVAANRCIGADRD